MIDQLKLIVVAKEELSNICKQCCTAYHLKCQNYEQKYPKKGKTVAKNGSCSYMECNPKKQASSENTYKDQQ